MVISPSGVTTFNTGAVNSADVAAVGIALKCSAFSPFSGSAQLASLFQTSSVASVHELDAADALTATSTASGKAHLRMALLLCLMIELFMMWMCFRRRIWGVQVSQ